MVFIVLDDVERGKLERGGAGEMRGRNSSAWYGKEEEMERGFGKGGE